MVIMMTLVKRATCGRRSVTPVSTKRAATALPSDSDAPSFRNERYEPKNTEPPTAAPGRRQRASAGDQGTQKARKPSGKAACNKKSKPE